MQLREQSANLHVNFALVLQFFQLFGGLLCKSGRQILRIYLMQAGVEAKSAFFKRTHFLETQGHVVHRHLDQEPIFGILLKFKTV